MSAASDHRDEGFFFNEMTGVVRGHRGRGIALAMKVLVIKLVRDLGVPEMRTLHHPDNKAPIALNRRLGYIDAEAPSPPSFGGSDVEGLLPELLALYRACFSAPPWNEAEEEFEAYAVRMQEWAQNETFTGLVARDHIGALVGAAYGWRGPAEFHGVPMPGVAFDVEWPFHVADLMVHPEARRQGLGRRLLAQLVDGRTPALLLTHPRSDSRHLYDAAGWRVTGEIEGLVVYALD